ncbi:DUF1573 domain-containing protein [Winogradskyella sp.]|uniref:DUF1573 domain-containing protein n=1 Tax=Winogradskyella sp. TaxID=1883156 RepID=UPI0026D9E4D6
MTSTNLLKRILRINIYIFSILYAITSCNSIDKYVSTIKINKDINLGIININDTVEKTLFIKNMSSVKLKINSIASSCECTLISFDNSLIKKNDSAYIRFQYIPESRGKFTKQIIIDANTKDPFTSINLTGEVY